MHNWDDVRFFLLLAREGSVNRAGKALGVSHTTVARRIYAFEKQLGTRLFDRTHEGYALTQAGEDMLLTAGKMEQSALSIDREMFGWDGDLTGPLTLTSPYNLVDALVVPKLHLFHKQYPKIDLKLLSTTSLLSLDNREADLALRISVDPPDHLVGRRLYPLTLGIYGTPKYIKTMGKTPKVIVYTGVSNTPDWVSEHFPNADVVLRTDSMTSAQAATRSGLGLAVIPCFHADTDKSLRRLRLETDAVRWGIWILSHAEMRTSARVRACRDFLVETIERQHKLILGETSRYATWSR